MEIDVIDALYRAAQARRTLKRLRLMHPNLSPAVRAAVDKFLHYGELSQIPDSVTRTAIAEAAKSMAARQRTHGHTYTVDQLDWPATAPATRDALSALCVDNGAAP